MLKTQKPAKTRKIEKSEDFPTKNILRYPRLDTVLMVENAIRKHSGEFGKKALWEHLPKKMMYQTYCVVIDYLLHSRKIAVDSEGTIGWTYNPEMTRYYLSRKDLALPKNP